MASERRGGLLGRFAVSGVVGLPDLDLEVGLMTALVGPRGSGKSQLLTAISWLITGRPPIAATDPVTSRATGELRSDRGSITLVRRPGSRLVVEPAGAAATARPTCSFLRARTRLGQPGPSTGSVARRLSGMTSDPTSDAVAAEMLLSVVEACCEERLTGEILLIEEPELFLTPQAQRYLYRLLRRFADTGNQVLYSTRSPAFVDAAHHDEIVRLDLSHGRSTVRRTRPATLSDAERVRLAAEFDHERSEMFFARTVLLVEGQTERLSLPFIFRALGHDPDAEGIAIVEVGGKSNLPLAARLLRQLEIPFVIVFDADRGAASAVLDAEIRRSAGPAPIIRLEPDFEAAAGIRSHEEKVLHAWRRFAGADAAAVPPALAAIVRAAAGFEPEPDRPRSRSETLDDR